MWVKGMGMKMMLLCQRGRSSREGSGVLKRGGNCRPELFEMAREDGIES